MPSTSRDDDTPMEGLSHLTFLVRDLERMARFLVHGLGAREVQDTDVHSFARAHEKFFVLGNLWIAAMKGEPPRERSYHHVALRVEPHDLPDYRRRLEDLGVEFRPARKRDAAADESIYFYDFDNHLFELRAGSLQERLLRYA